MKTKSIIETNQAELFIRDPAEHLFPYWRKSLKVFIEEALFYRHSLNSTGWSMGLQGYTFAQHLFRHGQLTRKDLKRYWKFNRRLKRWDKTRRQKP